MDSLHLYPEIAATELIARLAARLAVNPEEIALGSGSAEVVTQLIAAAAGEGDEVIFAWRSFEAYPRLVQIAGATPVPIALTSEGRHDLPAMAAAVTDRTKLILVCSPNNPTGTCVMKDELDSFLQTVPREVLVVIDEAYVHFNNGEGTADGLDFFRRYENVAVLHTFSKAYGLAGLRVGYAIAPEQITANLRRVALPFGVTALAQKAALVSLDAEAELRERVDYVISERSRVADALRDGGWSTFDSFGNFIWLRTGERTAFVHQQLWERGVLARAFIGEGIRVTVGNSEMNDVFLTAMRTLSSLREYDTTE
ncbi:histidinol-phosphate transaminase [Microbacterium kribbense]|uniref:Histidinol-phosphate transaminase n=2 Tax=Microbacterium kribbense TaxID=433645 RepID=A0ABP7G361_9MICO